jgi:uncharacterized membrane protein
MNSDGSRGIDIQIELGAKIPWLLGAGVGLLATGILGIIVSSTMIFFALRKEQPRPEKSIVGSTEIETGETKLKEEGEIMSAATEKTSMGMDPNVAGFLSYLLGWVTGIIFFVLERDNKFVRFHALQSIVVFGILSLVSGLIGWIPFLGWVVSGMLGVVAFILWIILMIKAYQGEKFKIIWAGDFAEKQVG